MTEFEGKIGYKFKNPELLKMALTHRSYAHEHGGGNNERLEFLGDSVLSIIVSEKLYHHLKNESEGELSKIRANLVCEQGLYAVAKKIDLEKHIKLGKGEEMTGGRQRPSVVSDAFEAVLAAVFLDSDFECAKSWLLKIMEKELKEAGTIKLKDYKTALQEHTQKGKDGKVSYRIVSESGPDHNKRFVCAVYVDDKKIAEGGGASKKEAEQKAAENALKLI